MDINKNTLDTFIIPEDKYTRICVTGGTETGAAEPEPKQGHDIDVTTEDSKKETPSTLYEATVQSGPDFVIRRTDKGRYRDLACIVSKGLYYIEADGKRTAADEGGIREFLSKLPEEGLSLPGVSWISRLFPGRGFAEDLFNCLNNSEYMEKAKRCIFYISFKDQDWRYSQRDKKKDRLDFKSHYCQFYSYSSYKTAYSNFEELEKILAWCVKDLVKRGATMQQALQYLIKPGCSPMSITGCMYSVRETYGPDAMHQFFEGLYETDSLGLLSCYTRSVGNTSNFIRKSLCTGPYSMDDVIKYNMKPSAFAEYASYGLANYGKAIPRFFSEWGDCLGMQIQLFGKIKEKYPADLATYHSILSEAVIRYRADIDMEAWKTVSEGWNEFEGSYGDYVVIAPKRPEDIYDEAVQQCNCLASYAKRVSEGEDMIFFLRKRSKPDVSVITIELHPDLTIGQVYGLRNREPEAPELNAVRAWAQDKGLYLPVVPEPEHG